MIINIIELSLGTHVRSHAIIRSLKESLVAKVCPVVPARFRNTWFGPVGLGRELHHVLEVHFWRRARNAFSTTGEGCGCGFVSLNVTLAIIAFRTSTTPEVNISQAFCTSESSDNVNVYSVYCALYICIVLNVYRGVND